MKIPSTRTVMVLAWTVSLTLILAVVPALAVTVVIDFDDLGASAVTNQFPEATFSSTAGFVNLTTAQSLGSSLPNFICTAPAGGSIDCTNETIVDFTAPVSALSFLEVGDNNSGVNALVDVFVNGLFVATVNAVGDGNASAPNLVDLTAFNNVTRVRIYNITDEAGLGWDDFTFDVGPAQVPEPTTLLVLGAGVIALAAVGWRRRGRP